MDTNVPLAASMHVFRDQRARMPHQFFDRHHGGEEDMTVAVSILE
jgi:hypothetical protein